jgi:hypothetical protein
MELTMKPALTYAESTRKGLVARVNRSVAIMLGLLGLTSCALGPAIDQEAGGYSAVMSNFPDEVMLTNILRAKDYAAAHLSDLSSISGSLSAQAGVNGTFPFGAPPGIASATNSIMPSLQYNNSPTFNTSPLNTQGFALSFLQPISPTYVVSKWNTLPKDLLLLLFAKYIRFADGQEYINDPDDAVGMSKYLDFLNRIRGSARLKSMTVLEPIGPILDPTKSNQGSAITTITNGQLYVGNAGPRDPSGVGYKNVQYYKEYPQQVVLCLDQATVPDQIYYEPTAEAPAAAGGGAGIKAFHGGGAKPPAAGAAAGGTGTNAAGSPNKSASPSPSAGTAMPAVTAALQSDRLSAILKLDECKSEQIVLKATTEEAFSKDSQKFADIEWRSTAELFQYLGAVIRRQDDPDWGLVKWPWTGVGVVHVEVPFRIQHTSGLINITYMGQPYSVASEVASPWDHSLQTLTMLNELVNVSKVSSDIPVQQVFRIIP